MTSGFVVFCRLFYFLHLHRKGPHICQVLRILKTAYIFCCVNMSRSDLPRFDYNTPMGVRRSVRLAMAELHQPKDSVEKDASARDLSRKRKFDQLDSGTSSVSFGNDAAQELCSNCQRIDFEGAFQNSDIRRKNCGVVIAELGRKGIEWGKAACPMCSLFAAVRVQPAGRPTTDSAEYHLRALPFLRATGNVVPGASLPQHLRKADSTCFLVLSSNGRSLRLPSHGPQSLTDLIHNSQSFGVICPIVSSATETLPRVGTRRLLPDRIDYNLLRNWYGFCTQNHRKTCAINSNEYPEMLKVIDCRTQRKRRSTAKLLIRCAQLRLGQATIYDGLVRYDPERDIRCDDCDTGAWLAVLVG